MRGRITHKPPKRKVAGHFSPSVNIMPEKCAPLTPEEFHDTLIEIKNVCDKLGITLIFILWPYEWQVQQPKPDPVKYQPILVDTCKEMGAALLNLYYTFVEVTEPL